MAHQHLSGFASCDPISPPPKRAHPREMWGEVVDDQWAWMADSQDPEVVSYLQAENEYTKGVMGPLDLLRKQIFQEIKSRVVETDLSVPVRVDDWLYYGRTEQDKSYPIHCRMPIPDGELVPAASVHPENSQWFEHEQVLLDENVEAAQSDFFDIGPFAVSPDHRRLFWGWDNTGDERYTATIRDLDEGVDKSDRLEDLAGPVAWFTDNETVLYVTPDQANRPYQVWRHRVGDPQGLDELVFEELDERFFVGVGLEKDETFIQIVVSSKVSDEVWLIPASSPKSAPRLVAERRQDVEYAMAHHQGRFVILTNKDGATNFKVMSVSDENPSCDNWEDLDIGPDLDASDPDSVMVVDIEITDSHLVMLERADGLTRIRLRRWDTAQISTIDQPDAPSTVWLDANPDMAVSNLRYGHVSMVSPPAVFDYDLSAGLSTLLKRQPVLGGYDPASYQTARIWATADDGVHVPISLVWRADRRSEPGPCLLYVYGAYEASIDPTFSVARLSLLDRGFVFAVAHVRGGGEMGRRWYLDGKLEQKTNTFTDLVACAQTLIDQGWTEPGNLVLRGGSAGGLAVGAAINLAPKLFAGVVAQVPFVDVLNTMCDRDLPLTVTEWEEWGDPTSDETIYRKMRDYGPYESVGPLPYPPIFATAGLNDTRVGFWEPTKWVAAIRENSTSDAPAMLWTDLGAGHGGPTGRYDAWWDEARVLTFVIGCVGAETTQHG